jgi:uncharacterized protein YndB with AHSA1/START domain
MDVRSDALARGRELTQAPVLLARTAHLGAEPAEVFAFIADFERLPTWMPLMQRCQVDNQNARSPGGVGAVRVIYPPVGAPARETVVALEPPHLLAYSASDASLRGMLRDHLGVITCAPHDAGGTYLSWVSFGRPGRLPQRWLAEGVFKFMVDRSIEQLRARFPRKAPEAR